MLADSASDDATKAVINDIIDCLGGEETCGKLGVSQAKVDQFFAEAAAYAEWWKKAGKGLEDSAAGAGCKPRRPPSRA